MNEETQRIVSALQTELQEYGGLLLLFDRQQERIIHHDPNGFLEINTEVEEQIVKLSRCRQEREQLVRDFAAIHGRAPETSLSDLLADFPPNQQPQIRALIEEINDLVTRSQRRARQNRMLLAQCVEAARQLVQATGSDNIAFTYSARGEVRNHIHRQGVVAAVA
jgi:flagellar biosynthesis/type III secretory pathway chaperone